MTTNTTQEELLPCPFCKGRLVFTPGWHKNVSCTSCKARLYTGDFEDDMIELANERPPHPKWNHRTPPASTTQEELCRADFEQYLVLEQGWSIEALAVHWDGNRYTSEALQDDWELWQAARRTPPAEQPSLSLKTATLEQLEEANNLPEQPAFEYICRKCWLRQEPENKDDPQF